MKNFVDQARHRARFRGPTTTGQRFAEKRDDLVLHAQFGIHKENGHVRLEVSKPVKKSSDSRQLHASWRRGFYLHIDEVTADHGNDIIISTITGVLQADIEEHRGHKLALENLAHVPFQGRAKAADLL